MPRLASRFVIALVIALVAAVPANAAWEAPQRIDQITEGFGNSGAGDVAVGDTSGLATILFLQNDDDGAKLWSTRRAAGDAAWLAPLGPIATGPSGAFTVEAAPDGATGGAYRQTEEKDPSQDNPTGADTHNVIGLGWASDASSVPPKTADLADQADEGTPPVDTDGNGFGWTAYVDSDNNLQIIRFQLNDPTKVATFEIAAIEPSPGDFNGNQTESRSNPRIDVNAAGDVIVSFVEAQRQLNQSGFRPPVDAVYAVRKQRDKNAFTGPFLISQEDEQDPVTEHDPAIVDNGDATILFAANPESGDSNRVYARRWLATGLEPRDPTEGPELVSKSDEDAAAVSQIRAEAGPAPRVTAAWLQGGSQLNSAERSTTWTLPQVLSTTAGSYDIAADAEGVATAVYRESTSVRARRRAAGQQWAAADTINTAPVPTDSAPKVDAGPANQADAYLVQNDGTRRGAFATRFTGAPPTEPEAPELPDTGDCPADITIHAGDAGANSIAGVDGRDTILGGDGDDTLSGAGGDDCVRGQGGNDTAAGGTGNDDVGGGDGDDRVNGDDGNDRVHGDAGTDTVNGGAGDDTGTGGDGNDTVDGSAGDDMLNGEAGDDKVRGGDGNDVLGGADGNDTVSGNAGTNTLFGGLGNDRLLGGPQRDTVVGEDGDDVLSAGAGPDNLNGGTGNDKLRGGTGKNVLDGAEGDDGMRGGAQSDRVLGSAGLDTLFGLAGNDSLSGGDDDDKAYGGSGNDRLAGDGGKDGLRGGKGADRLNGGDGGDKLNGDGGSDRISGGSGNDRVRADDGRRDRITCGAGKDRVVADPRDKVSKSCEKVRRTS